MGKKAGTVLTLLVAFSLLSQSLTAEASSASDLYEIYGETFDVSIPEDVVTTINSYNNAKRYVSMYNYVVNSEYDLASVKDEISQLDKELASLEEQLLSGYDKDISELYKLEEKYSDTYTRKCDLEQSIVTYDVNSEPITVSSVPTYSEYVEAVRSKNDVMSRTEIGKLEDLLVPVQSKSKLIEHSNDYSEYKCLEGTGVLSPFNGIVDDVIIDDTYGMTVIIDNYNGIKTYLCNLESVDISIGETVYQNQRVGYVLGSRVIFRLSLNDKFVDISKIFIEDLN